MSKQLSLRYAIAFVSVMLVPPGWAQLVISDTLSGASSSYSWVTLGGACLTAGNNTGSIPACAGLAYYSGKTLVGGDTGTMPDVVGHGALRLTNGDTQRDGSNGNAQTGAVFSTFTFPSNQGVQVTFTTATYGGNGYTNRSGQQSGADGMSFYLTDASKSPPGGSAGGAGGALGYSCSNGNAQSDGVIGAYLGVGIDEFGNFSNPGDTTASGPGVGPSRISLRGAGSVAWAALNAAYPTYYPRDYPDPDKSSAVQRTCRSGHLYNLSGATIVDATGKSIPNESQTNESIYDYPLIAYADLPITIYNQEYVSKPTRAAATPITYALTITQDGLLSLSYSVNGGTAQPVITKQSITASNGPLPQRFQFGFAASTGSGSNVHEIMCFKAVPMNLSSGTAGTNVQQAARVQAGTQVYLAYYRPTNWWGQMTATDLLYDAATDRVSIAALSNWDASCVLTGGDRAAPAARGGSAQASGSRSLLTWNGSSGIALQWNTLSNAQKASLTAGDATTSDARLRYLRGDRSDELTTSGVGKFRARDSVLGDIIDSSPTWVGPPSLPYSAAWKDALHPSASMPEGTSYGTFQSSNATRLNVVYVGANDGLLHGFRAGSYDASGHFAADLSKPNDGREVLGYVPGAVLATLHSTTASLDYASPQYAHNDYVDATPGTGDLYYGGAWHTWLVGGLGPGGSATGPIADTTTAASGAIYALDITNPANFSESNAAGVVLGEWTSATIKCSNVKTCGRNLGATYGTPAIRRLHNGQWAVIFGNGLNSSTGTAGIFVMSVNPATGAATFRYLDTGYGPSRDPAGGGAKNGIAYVAPVDLDGDHVTDYVYAGDVFGNVWRFDLTSDTPGSWTAASTPMFSTGGQPITTRPVVVAAPTKGGTRVIVEFATGRQLAQTQTSASTYASGTQSLYGVWDWDMSAWNRLSTTRYASLAAPQTVTPSRLQAQTVDSSAAATSTAPASRTVSQNAVCWQGSNACASGNDRYGWKLDLPTSTEQVVYSPITAYGMFIVNTTIPAVSQTLSCAPQPASGYTMAVSAITGGASTSSFFSDASGASGLGLNATGSPSIVTARSHPYLVQQTSSGIGSVTKVNAFNTGRRLTWINLR